MAKYVDPKLAAANSANLVELREILAAQEGGDKLFPITMTDILISAGAVNEVANSVKRIAPEAKKVLMVTGPTKIVDNKGEDVKEKVKALLETAYEVEWLMLSEPGVLHATPENAAKIQARLDDNDCVVGVGGGTICDLCKYSTHYADPENSKPLVVVETALSVNAFSDDASVMLISGVKRTVHSRYPDILIIDLDIQAAAPAEMNVSGYGDLIATWTAPVDWYLANVLGMGKNFSSIPSDMIRDQCRELLKNSEKLAAGDMKVLEDLANALTLSGLAMGLGGESSPASGSEHVMSHLIDMTTGIRKSGTCYHGTQVAVSGLNSEILYDYLLNEFDPKSIDVDKCYPTAEEMEPKVRAAFGWLDEEGNAANECWSDYSKKLAKWHECRPQFEAFLANFDQFKEDIADWVMKPEYVAECMHKANHPTKYSRLNYPVPAETATWAVNNCHLMRNRFSIIDLLYFCGIWNEEFVQTKVLDRAAAMDAGL